MSQEKCQLYIISPETIEPDILAKNLDSILATGHVAVFQLRLKNVEDKSIIKACEKLMPICHKHGVQFILNDHIQIAKQVNADGVHVGEEKDGTYQEARQVLGENKIVGVSCYGSTDRALEFAELGADYVAFGTFYPTQTKKPKANPQPEILQWWTQNCVVPCVAIGGINTKNCAPLVSAGADFIAVVSAIWQHPESPTKAVQELHNTITRVKK